MKELKKVIILISISFLSITQGLAQSTPIEIDSEKAEFYYKKGYKEAGNKYYKLGYKQAEKDIRKELENFKLRHEAIEASKYLSLTGKISYAEVLKKRDGNGGHQIIIIPPRVEKEMSVYDLIKIPDALEDYDVSNEDDLLKSKNENSFYGQEEYASKANKGILKDASTINDEITMNVPKTRKARQVLDVAGIPYTEGVGSYKVYYRSEFEKENFCNGEGAKICP